MPHSPWVRRSRPRTSPCWRSAPQSQTRTPGPSSRRQLRRIPLDLGLRGALADRPDPASASSAAVPATAAIPTGRWQPLGPAPSGPPYLQGGDFYAGPNSGRITALVNIPSGLHSGRVVAGTAGGGIWTSDDGGTTWTPRTDSAANLAIGAVALDPSNANHLVAGTGEETSPLTPSRARGSSCPRTAARRGLCRIRVACSQVSMSRKSRSTHRTPATSSPPPTVASSSPRTAAARGRSHPIRPMRGSTAGSRPSPSIRDAGDGLRRRGGRDCREVHRRGRELGRRQHRDYDLGVTDGTCGRSVGPDDALRLRWQQ